MAVARKQVRRPLNDPTTARVDGDPQRFVDYLRLQYHTQPHACAVSFPVSYPPFWRSHGIYLIACSYSFKAITERGWVPDGLWYPFAAVFMCCAVIFLYHGVRRSTSAKTHEDLTFSELYLQSCSYAKILNKHGIGPRDRVLLLVRPSGVQIFPVLFGIMRAGAVPVIPDVKVMSLQENLRAWADLSPVAIVGLPFVAIAKALVSLTPLDPLPSVNLVFYPCWFPVASFFRGRWLPSKQCTDQREAEGFEDESSSTSVGLHQTTLDDEMLVLWTTGTTGHPKAVRFTQLMGVTNAQMLSRMTEARPGMVMLDHNLAFIMFDISAGIKTIVSGTVPMFNPGDVEPKYYLQELRLVKPSIVYAAPVVWMKLASYLQRKGYCDGRISALPPSIRLLLSGGAPLPVGVYKKIQAASPDKRSELLSVYGSTECLPIAVVRTSDVLGNDQDAAYKETLRGGGICAGYVVPGVSIRIIKRVHSSLTDTSKTSRVWSKDLESPFGEIGEIVISGANVSPSYLNDDEANLTTKLSDRVEENKIFYHRTGDLGYFDKAGRLWYCGRLSHAITLANGRLVPSIAVEAIFNEHPSVFRCALVAVGPLDDPVCVIAVELEGEPGAIPWTDELEESILRCCGPRSPWHGVVERALPYALSEGRLPVDHRHNSKILRPKVQYWARRQHLHA